MSDVIYKIVTEDLWLDARGKGVFDGASIDLADGYIHLSTAGQAQGTADKYFAGQTGLLLIAVDVDRLGDTLRWEPSRGGELFPHLYAPLTFDAVLWEKPLVIGADGRHQFPEI
ncbi:DUF952 domain-containing protein [Neorhizobium sp. JUb45]|uniref:DUF952 domain-containing protein n=1 Tax=unclassified Neorhizobium TaxID=2629175 RepID=UPI0010E98579|nr:uncharacterized protein (DUF952 family) [Neorhizobium sp. JUb45]